MDCAVKSRCFLCNAGVVIRWRHAKNNRLCHVNPRDDNTVLFCMNEDDECRHIGEPLGWYEFAWWPRRCRNNRVRWLCSVERHTDGTYTLGNRAH